MNAKTAPTSLHKLVEVRRVVRSLAEQALLGGEDEAPIWIPTEVFTDIVPNSLRLRLRMGHRIVLPLWDRVGGRAPDRSTQTLPVSLRVEDSE
jgi:hypothetical protein